MKKITALVLSAVLLLSLGVLAFADGTTTLTTTVPAATYTLTIPQDMKVTYGVNSVEVKSLDAEAISGFAVGKNLKVTVSYSTFACKGISTTIPYTVDAYIPVSHGSTVGYGSIASDDMLIFTCVDTNTLRPTDLNGGTHGSGSSYSYDYAYLNYYFTLFFSNSDWGKALAGDYTATMTFTSEIVAAETT